MPFLYIPACFLLISALNAAAFANEAAAPYLHEFSSEFAYVNLRTKKAHATVSAAMKKKGDVYEMAVKGIGNFERYTNVQWAMASTMSEESSQVRTQESHVRITNKDGKELRRTQRTYDYQGKKIIFKE